MYIFWSRSLIMANTNQETYGESWREQLTPSEGAAYDRGEYENIGTAPRESNIVPRRGDTYSFDEAMDQRATPSDPGTVLDLSRCLEALAVLGELPAPCNCCGLGLGDDPGIPRYTVVVHTGGDEPHDRVIAFCTSCFKKYKVPVDPRTNLTKRQADILELRKKGLAGTQIAEKLGISASTVSREINERRKSSRG
jgi:Bacterial regulatory proteins, luxR family